MLTGIILGTLITIGIILDIGLTETASRFASDITQGQWGTGTSIPAPTDTGLESGTAGSLLTMTASSSGNSAQFTHTLGSTLVNGIDLTEFEIIFDDAGSTSFNRTVGGAINKTASFDVVTITTVSFIRG